MQLRATHAMHVNSHNQQTTATIRQTMQLKFPGNMTIYRYDRLREVFNKTLKAVLIAEDMAEALHTKWPSLFFEHFPKGRTSPQVGLIHY